MWNLYVILALIFYSLLSLSLFRRYDKKGNFSNDWVETIITAFAIGIVSLFMSLLWPATILAALLVTFSAYIQWRQSGKKIERWYDKR